MVVSHPYRHLGTLEASQHQYRYLLASAPTGNLACLFPYIHISILDGTYVLDYISSDARFVGRVCILHGVRFRHTELSSGSVTVKAVMQ